MTTDIHKRRLLTLAAAATALGAASLAGCGRKEEAAPAAPSAPSTQEVLLTEIRDLLKEKH